MTDEALYVDDSEIIGMRRPFSVKTLAERWECSESHIRKAIAAGELRAFGIGGKLVRIAAEEVARIEGGACRTSGSGGTAASLPHAGTKVASDSAAHLVRLINRPQKLSLSSSRSNTTRRQAAGQ
jgi:excisionase family DNA binding protein